jgi:hypothetical protein
MLSHYVSLATQANFAPCLLPRCARTPKLAAGSSSPTASARLNETEQHCVRRC